MSNLRTKLLTTANLLIQKEKLLLGHIPAAGRFYPLRPAAV
jgi:hypothetical protein